jgi:hypothetical protein
LRDRIVYQGNSQSAPGCIISEQKIVLAEDVDRPVPATGRDIADLRGGRYNRSHVVTT